VRGLHDVRQLLQVLALGLFRRRQERVQVREQRVQVGRQRAERRPDVQQVLPALRRRQLLRQDLRVLLRIFSQLPEPALQRRRRHRRSGQEAPVVGVRRIPPSSHPAAAGPCVVLKTRRRMGHDNRVWVRCLLQDLQ